MTDARRSRVLAVVDDRTRECLAPVPGTSPSGTRAARELETMREPAPRSRAGINPGIAFNPSAIGRKRVSGPAGTAHGLTPRP